MPERKKKISKENSQSDTPSQQGVMLNIAHNINAENQPDEEQTNKQPEQPKQPIYTNISFNVNAEVIPDDEDLYQRFYRRLKSDLKEALACSCEGCHDH